MTDIEKILANMRNAPSQVGFSDFMRVCTHCFGEPRRRGTSHCVFKMPWAGNPRVNIQPGKNGKAKEYQIKQALNAIDKLGKDGL